MVCMQLIVPRNISFRVFTVTYNGCVTMNSIIDIIMLTTLVSYRLLMFVLKFLSCPLVFKRCFIRDAASHVRNIYSFIIASITADLIDRLVSVRLLTRLMTVALTSMNVGLVTSRLNAGTVSARTASTAAYDVPPVALALRAPREADAATTASARCAGDHTRSARLCALSPPPTV